jgi:hypothetical protein
MVSQDALPENLVARCLDVLRTLSANERDLIRVVVEVVHDLRDPSDSDDDVPVSISELLSLFQPFHVDPRGKIMRTLNMMEHQKLSNLLGYFESPSLRKRRKKVRKCKRLT